MKIEKAKRIRQTWDEIEREDPDISTPRLMRITGERHGVDDGDVATALRPTQEPPQPK